MNTADKDAAKRLACLLLWSEDVAGMVDDRFTALQVHCMRAWLPADVCMGAKLLLLLIWSCIRFAAANVAQEIAADYNRLLTDDRGFIHTTQTTTARVQTMVNKAFSRACYS